MKKPFLYFMLRYVAFILFLFLLMQPTFLYIFFADIAVLFPKGMIGVEERDLFLIIQVLMLLVIVPVYVLTFVFSWKYRATADNTEGIYDPDLVDNKLAEVVWWGVPLVITVIISVLTWVKTHELDPYRPIPSDRKPLTIQAVALQWKWLFIYPEEKIAVVNFLQIPKERPIHFVITADAPMNSLWIPALGGQIYAMPAMKTQLHLIADVEGDFRGCSANISGTGFAGMHFITRASSDGEYDKWLKEAQSSSKGLDFKEYEKKLAAPSENDPVEIYTLKDDDLFDRILMKFMRPHPTEEVASK